MAVSKFSKIGQGRQRNSDKNANLATDLCCMRPLYNFLTHTASLGLSMAGVVNPKLKAFVRGRKPVFHQLRSELDHSRPTVWFHCASLGEFEQGLPIMEGIKASYPNSQLLVSFFSPSGYGMRRDHPVADAVVYLPLDTPANARKFIDLADPALAIFVKYEFWPNYLEELHRNNIPTLLVSGVFRPDQVFYKWYGGIMRKALNRIEHFFVQDMASARHLAQVVPDERITHSGDTRFDRVSHQIEADNNLPFADEFVDDKLCLVCGSTWPEDMAVLLPFLNASQDLKIILAPHRMDGGEIEAMENQLDKKVIRYSQREGRPLADYDVLIVDTIGLLSRLYSYADIAYVGGAMGNSGLHNILEAATFGVPIVIGKNFQKFPEAVKLEDIAGLYSVKDPEDCSAVLEKLVNDKRFREQTGMICGHFVNANTGATKAVLDYIDRLHRDRLV